MPRPCKPGLEGELGALPSQEGGDEALEGFRDAPRPGGDLQTQPRLPGNARGLRA